MTLFLTVVIAILLILLIPYLGRVVVGPFIFDRIVALNAIGSKAPVILVLIGFLYSRVDMFVDLALALFLLNLFTTLLIARFVRQKAEVA